MNRTIIPGIMDLCVDAVIGNEWSEWLICWSNDNEKDVINFRIVLFVDYFISCFISHEKFSYISFRSSFHWFLPNCHLMYLTPPTLISLSCSPSPGQVPLYLLYFYLWSYKLSVENVLWKYSFLWLYYSLLSTSHLLLPLQWS